MARKKKATKRTTKARKRGGRTPGATAVVDADVVEVAAQALARGMLKWKVKRLIRDWIFENRNGREVAGSTVEKVMKFAIDHNLRTITQDRERARQEGLERYTAIRDDPTTPQQVQVKAQERIDELLGTSAKYSGTGGFSPEATAARARQALEEMGELFETIEDNPAIDKTRASSRRPGTSAKRRPTKRPSRKKATS